MSAPFLGYLLKIANSSIIFPNHYIQYETWKSTPNQREEIKAYRDDNTRDLFRVTAEGRKTIISFSTRPGLNLQDKLIIQDFFNCGETEFNGMWMSRYISHIGMMRTIAISQDIFIDC